MKDLRAHFSDCILWLQRDWPSSSCDCGVLSMEAMPRTKPLEKLSQASGRLVDGRQHETGTLPHEQGNLLISEGHGLCGEHA